MDAIGIHAASGRSRRRVTVEEPDFGRQEVRGMNTPQDESRNVNPADPGSVPGGPDPAQAPATPAGAPASQTRPAAPPSYRSNAATGPGWSTAMDPRRKSVALASVLSLMPGLGQVYVGYYQLGFIYILIVTGIITILANDAGPLTALFGVSLAFFWLYNIVDAGRRAALYNAALNGGAMDDVPRAQIPMNRGSRVGGSFLIVIGILFLLHTRFGFDMYWIEDWWPLALIVLGAWLFARDRASRSG